MRSAIVILGLLLATAQPAPAATVTLEAVASGFYLAGGSHSEGNYAVGWYGAPNDDEIRDYFVFDLSGVTGTIESAVLRLSTAPPGFVRYGSEDPSETFTLFDVSTDLAALTGGTGGEAAYADLAGGTSYGGLTVSPSLGATVDVPLNAAGIAYLASRHGQVALGGAVTTLARGTASEFLFNSTSASLTRQLIVTTSDGAPPVVPNYQGLWWNPAESGWGINFTHQGDTIFATWFTYDAAGKPVWLAVVATLTSPGVYKGDLFVTRGPAFNAVPFVSANVVETTVGTATFTIVGDNEISFAYTLDLDSATKSAVTQTRTISRQTFGTLPVCTWGGAADLATATNYTDLWWAAPPGAESGWGINFTQQDGTIFATWFTYDVDGKPWWLAFVANGTGPGIYTGDVFTTTGPPFSALPWGPAPVVETTIGTATLTFADGNNASFAYTVNGTTQTKAITRQVFAPPGTACE